METPTTTIEKFHLGVSADGQSCMLMFVDEQQRTMRCVADFSEFNAFIASLTKVAGEMARRRSDTGEEAGPECGTLNVAFAEFQLSPTDAYIEGALVGDAGQIVGIRMCPEVAAQISKAMLMTTPPASRC
jgi:hypothetical protein